MLGGDGCPDPPLPLPRQAGHWREHQQQKARLEVSARILMRFVHGAWWAQHPWDHSRAGGACGTPSPHQGWHTGTDGEQGGSPELAMGFVLPGSALLSFVSAGWIMSCNYQRWLADEQFCSPPFSQHVSTFRACGVPGEGSWGGELTPCSAGFPRTGKQLLSPCRLRELPPAVPRALRQPDPRGCAQHHRGGLPRHPGQQGQVRPGGDALQHRELGLRGDHLRRGQQACFWGCSTQSEQSTC